MDDETPTTPEDSEHDLADGAPSNVVHTDFEPRATKTADSAEDALTELKAMQISFEALSPLAEEARRRAVFWLIEALGLTDLALTGSNSSQPHENPSSYAPASVGKKTVSARDFMSQKKPGSQVERIACLAYYLAHHRDTPHFKASDISALNLEAAGQKFGNLPRDLDNADRQSGYVVSAGQGAKQMTTRGDAVVEALPDREAVKAALHEHPHRQKRSSGGKKSLPDEKSDK
ncbi:hypothetical protein Q5425_18070 [Amycolatopsis sp. A133]|uniref:hypothetical protein n=1 Tax=Amycolatopsis sp. A133 TaxID=3064472 RepID=UPI0027E5E7FB|nr:hypothetical protein [Amycolatopsis sp. A133]MDQ7805655.1 hypothetical protein [Amycolatopsis sp. A133]